MRDTDVENPLFQINGKTVEEEKDGGISVPYALMYQTIKAVDLIWTIEPVIPNIQANKQTWTEEVKLILTISG